MREAFGRSARTSTSNSQAFHNSLTAPRRERMNRVTRSTLGSGVRADRAEESAAFETTRGRPFQDDASRVRTRALRSAMSVPLAAQSSHAPHSVSADEAIASADDPFPNCGARESTRVEMSRGFATGARNARQAEAKLARAHRARNALPQVVRPELEPLPPSTRVRSLRASRTPSSSPSCASPVAQCDRDLGVRPAAATQSERERASSSTVARVRSSSSFDRASIVRAPSPMLRSATKKCLPPAVLGE
jgi:hypothetical protein